MARSDWIGETLSGRYEITELLGQGGMSAVYKANDPNLRRVVAVKLIHSHLSSDPQFVRRFEEEAAAVAQLRHSNLIQVFDFTNDDETYYIVFEFVPGETVQARLKRLRESDRQMGVEEATSIIAQSADGLDYAHNKGLIHRDIKPANIMLNVQNQPIIMDFGIAKIMGGTQHTATGAVLGTARYMSPEQIKGERVDARTDVYSLGVTMFEMLGGRPPFNADSAMTLMMMHMTDPVPDLRNLRADIPVGLVAIVNKALAKDPDARFQSAAEFAAALNRPAQFTAAMSATTLQTGDTKAADPEMTIVEPVVAAAALADTGSGAAQTGGSAAPSSATATTTSSASGSRNWLYIAGGALALILLLGGIWAVFLRDDGGGEELAAVAISQTEEAAAVAAPTEEAAIEEPPELTQEPIEEPAEEPTEEPQEAPTAEPEEIAPPPVTASFAAVDGDVTVINDGEETIAAPDTVIMPGSQIVTGENGEVEFTLEDGSIIQLGGSSILEVVDLAADPADTTLESVLALHSGDFLLRQPEPGNILTLLDGEDNLLGSLQAAASSSEKPARSTARHLAQVSYDEAAMAITLGQDIDEAVRISCFAGLCTVGDSYILYVGEELAVDRVERVLLWQRPITQASESYAYWQETCTGCLPTATDAVAETNLATATIAPTTEAPPTEPAPPPTEAPPTATSEAPPTEAPPTATTEAPTAEPTATEPAAGETVRITNIALQDGRYIVSYETYGYTESWDGMHVHFYFDTVGEANSGYPGNGPWKLYGGPRPFTEYGEGDRPGGATAMCAVVATADHYYVAGTGNCFPLP